MFCYDNIYHTTYFSEHLKVFLLFEHLKFTFFLLEVH